MIEGARPGARKLALFAVIAGTVAGIALGVIGCIEGVDDADLYGRVSLPGSGALDLPEGDVALYYESRVTLGENDSLDVPDGLRVVAVRENTRVRSEKVLQNEISTDGRALREFAKLEIPREGRYRVTVRSRQGGSYSPAVTFGKGQLGNLADSAAKTGIPIGAGVGAALLILLLGRIGYERPTPYDLAAAMRRPQAMAGAPPVPGAPGWWPGTTPPGTTPPVPGSTPTGTSSPVPGSATPPVPGTTPPARSSDPVEVQLRELEGRHEAGQLSDEDYQRRRREVIDSAVRPPGG